MPDNRSEIALGATDGRMIPTCLGIVGLEILLHNPFTKIWKGCTWSLQSLIRNFIIASSWPCCSTLSMLRKAYGCRPNCLKA